MTVIGEIQSANNSPTIEFLYLKLKEKNYRNPTIENISLYNEGNGDFEQWVRTQLELDRRNVFKSFYRDDEKLWKHHLAQAQSDYLMGYILYSVDYLVMQLKIN